MKNKKEYIPPENATEDEVWEYALSFNGYRWVIDKFKAGQLEEIISEDNKEFLDKHIYPNDDWRNGIGEPCAPALISCIGGGKDLHDVSVEELRAILFWEQRGNRWHDEWTDASLEFAKNIICEIRSRLTNKQVEN